MTRRALKSWLWALPLATLIGAALALGAIACGDDGGEEAPEPTATEEPAAQIPDVFISAADYSFQAPASIAGGITRLSFQNDSAAEDHQAQLIRLNDGVAFEDFQAAFETIESEADVPGVFAGGPGAGPGLSNSNVLNMEPGQYVLLCLIPSPTDGVIHAAKGMMQALEVTAAAAEQPELPTADLAVSAYEFTFDVPETLPAGETTFDVTNDGAQDHEMALIRLEGGFTVDQLLDLFFAEPDPEAPPPEGPPPFSFLGQVAVMATGRSGQTTIDLTPGSYAFLCFVTDPTSGQPHAALGMAKPVTVE
jgi:hypothetical protein